MKRVGIIGGMGPLATIDLYAKIVEFTNAKCDQENIPLLIDNFPQIEDRTAFILGRGKDPLPKLIESAKRLKNGGCEAIAMACNTAHFFASEIEKNAEVKILHIAKIAVCAILKNFPNAKNIAVIGTDGTKKAGIYDSELLSAGLNSVQISPVIQAKIMSCIYDGVKAGKILDFVPVFEEILNEIKADIYIAACTEIPLFLPLIKSEKNFIDPTLELAKAIVEFSKN